MNRTTLAKILFSLTAAFVAYYIVGDLLNRFNVAEYSILGLDIHRFEDANDLDTAASVLMSQGASTTTRFAIIGDYGKENKDVFAVSELVKSWNPEFIATVGDNNYPDGRMSTFDDNVGQYYHQFIYNYIGEYGEGSAEPRFFPSLGNHDWESIYCNAESCNGPYFEYFGIDVSDRYYTLQKGPVRLFMMDSDSKEPDGISGVSNQAVWLKEQLAASDATWNLVLLHHPPYSSGGHRSHELLQWPFAQWGADVVFSGHNHLYERIERDDMLFFINGLGGKSRHYFREVKPSWVKFRYNEGDGAMLLEATTESITYKFYDRFGTLHDSHTVLASQDDEDEIHVASTHQNVVAQINHASNDVVQSGSGAVEQIGYVLNLGEVRDDEPTLVGLRFTDVQVPPDAVIVEARIEFANQRDENSDALFSIVGEKACNAKPFTPLPHDLSTRAKTTHAVHWTGEDEWELVGKSYFTTDIAPIVQEIVDYGGWQQGNAMAFYLQGSGSRNAASYELQPEMAPKLEITYDIRRRSDADIDATAGSTDSAPVTSTRPAISTYIPMLVNYQCVLD